jgi:inosine triphosphate pyrophosphatase
MAAPKLVFVSSNTNKHKEVRQILGDAFEVESVKLDLPELQGTIENIVIDKCRRAADIVSLSLCKT